MIVSRHHRFIAVLSFEHLDICDVMTGRRVSEIGTPAYGMTFTEDGSKLITTSPEGLAMWDLGPLVRTPGNEVPPEVVLQHRMLIDDQVRY